MENNIGVIGTKVLNDYFFDSSEKGSKLVTKIFVDSAEHGKINKLQFPFAEIVSEVSDITNDRNIDTIIVCENKIEYATDALKAGKAVRII